MSGNTADIDIDYIKEMVLCKFPLLGVNLEKLDVMADNKVVTAATDGNTVYYSPNFFSKLDENQQTFTFAHEVLHVAFNHLIRSKDHDPQLWNVATDAVINQILHHEGLDIPEGYIDIPQALNKSADEMYDLLLKERENSKEQGEQNQQQGGSSQQSEPNQQQGSSSQQSESNQQQGGNSQQGEPNQQQGGSSQQGEQNQQQGEGKNTGELPESSKSQAQQNQVTPQSTADTNADKKSSNPQVGGHSSQSLSGQSKNQFTGESQAAQKDNNSILSESNLKNASNAAAGSGNHEIWKKALKEHEDKEKRKTQIENVKKMFRKESEQSSTQNIDGSKSYSLGSDFCSSRQQDGSEENYESSFLANNAQKRHNDAQKSRIAIEKNKYQILRKAMLDSNFTNTEPFGEVGETKQKVADWRKVLKKSIEEEDSRWSYRRSNAANDYMARVEEIEEESKAKTQVMIDVSGSVNTSLVREFLRQVKPILKDSDLEVGFFDDTAYEFQKIKKVKDIDNLRILGGGGTDIDNAVRAFSRKKEVNKIVFTDGYGRMPADDLAKMNVLWVVYDNNNFNPVCGQVIYVNKYDIMEKSHTDYDNAIARQYLLKNRNSR